MNGATKTDLYWVRRHGGPIAHAALDPERCRFRVEGIAGMIAYTQMGRSAVMLGDPICAAEHQGRLAAAFADHARQQGWSILIAVASARLRGQVLPFGWAALEFANLLVLDPRPDPEHGADGRHLRQQLNHTRREGVTVSEYAGSGDAALESQVQTLYDRWRTHRYGPQMYLGVARLFEHRVGRRWFIARRGNAILGCLSLLEAGGTGSPYLLNQVFSDPTSPPHTNELLIVTALAALRVEGCPSVCLGIGPRSALGRIDGCNPERTGLASWLYKVSGWLLHPDHKTRFWAKFGARPQEPLYLLFQDPRLRLRDIYALLRAFHAGLG
jgi:lysylphosphatidylglycerol synthetase-like protein (DUF2156 family)